MRKNHRAVVECSALEARRLLCMDGDLPGVSSVPAYAGDVAHVHASAGDASVDVLIVPAYSSRPSATRKLFLDFNGHPAIDNWGGWWLFGGKDASATPAYDIDGDTSSFSTQELANIEKIWKGVAEKFSPFNVDVTTVQPSKINGVRVVIGGDGAWYGKGGGVAIVGGWGEEGFIDANAGNVAFVWSGPNSPTYVAEAAAHEAGHTLGLYHHSLNPIQQNEYAAGYIMGSGDGGIGRWANTSVHGTVATTRDGDTVKSKGSQDDLAEIVSGNGFGYRPDDHGSTLGTATALPLAFQSGVLQGAAGGVIEQSGDQDYFSFSHTGGSIDIEVLAAEFRRMLDPRLTLRASNNSVIASSINNSGSDGVGERIQLNSLNAGTYYIQVNGSGAYGDIGQYRLHVRAGLATTAFNDTMATATKLGLFGQTDSNSVAIGFHGTAIINDSLASNDNYDFFRFTTPPNTRQVYVRLSGKTIASSLALYDDRNGNGLVDAGEILYSSNPGIGVESYTHTQAAGAKTYFVRVARDTSGSGSGNYQLRVSADAAPGVLPATLGPATFDPQPLVGGRLVYGTIDAPAGDTVDYYRVTAGHNGLFSFYLNFSGGDLRMDVGTDTNGNGVLDAGEILATSAIPASSFEFIQELPAAQGQQLLIRISQQAAGASANYTLDAIADYATGGNTTGSLAGARDITDRAAGVIYEYLDGSVDFFDTFRIAPPPGPFEAQLINLALGPGHRIQLIRDANNNHVVDAGEIVATSDEGGFSHNVTAGAPYYLRVTTRLVGEFPTVGNYGFLFAGAGSILGSTPAAPTGITPTTTPANITGYLGYFPGALSVVSDTTDYYQFTIAARTRFDATINHPAMGLQVGTLDGQQNFVRLGGIGTFDGPTGSLSVNLDPGTYILRAVLPVEERQETFSGGNYTITYNTGPVTDNVLPGVTASEPQYEIRPLGASFFVNKDVIGSVDIEDVVIFNLATNVSYPIGRAFYDPTTRKLGYAVEAGVLPDGNYRATLLAGSIRDTSTNPLPSSVSFDFFIFAGDANRDRSVDLSDFAILASRFNLPGTFSQGDFNYDRVTGIADFAILASRFNTTLPAPRNPVTAPEVGGAPAGRAEATAPFGTRRVGGLVEGLLDDPV